MTTDKSGNNSRHQNDRETAEQAIISVWQNKLLEMAGPIRLIFFEYGTAVQRMADRKGREMRKMILAMGTAALVVSANSAIAQENMISWPQEIGGDKGTIVVYQPQPEKLTSDVLTGRAAFSLEFRSR